MVAPPTAAVLTSEARYPEETRPMSSRILVAGIKLITAIPPMV
jgi:hypothetical protein